MIPFEEIQKLSDVIVREFNPEKIILFGSYANGKPTKDSDVDLLVILPFEGRMAQQSARMRAALSPSYPIDLLARLPEDTLRRYREHDPLICSAIDNGKVLYDRGS